MSHAAEIHEMRVKTIRLVKTTVIVEVHARIVGEPGVSWFQDAELHIAGGTIVQVPAPGTFWATDGGIEVAGVQCDSRLPLPFRRSGATRLHFVGDQGVLEITGTSAGLVLMGERAGQEPLP
jgi:hypothetical protein